MSWGSITVGMGGIGSMRTLAESRAQEQAYGRSGKIVRSSPGVRSLRERMRRSAGFSTLEPCGPENSRRDQQDCYQLQVGS